MTYIKATFKINGEIKEENLVVGTPDKKDATEAEKRRYAMAQALRYATGYGDEEYYSWDDPEILERELIKLEFVEE